MKVKVALLQMDCSGSRAQNLTKAEQFIRDAAEKHSAQVLLLPEVFHELFFITDLDLKHMESSETIPGPITEMIQALAKELGVVICAPIYERVGRSVYYNSAAMIDADGKLLGIYRKNHIPLNTIFFEKLYFKPGNLGYPAFDTAFARIGVYICYDRHFPEGARCLGLNGAEIVFNPSATVAGLSEYLWELEQPAHAVANQYFVAAINRVGTEHPWQIGEFYGKSYFCNPRGQFLVEAPRDQDALIVADLDLDQIREVRNTWQFFRDRRPDTYGALVAD